MNQNVDEENILFSTEEAKYFSKQIFMKIDTDRDGLISHKDIIKWRIKNLNEMNLNDEFTLTNQKIFYDTLDYNKDGYITEKDFENFYLRHFSQILL